MRQIYKTLISIFVIMILAMGQVSAKETDNKGKIDVHENMGMIKHKISISSYNTISIILTTGPMQQKSVKTTKE